MSGPKFKKTYCGHGKFFVKYSKFLIKLIKILQRGTEYNVKEFGMIAGGTGLAPMYQVKKFFTTVLNLYL